MRGDELTLLVEGNKVEELEMQNYLLLCLFQAAVYGMAQQIPDRSMVSELSCSFVDNLYMTATPTKAEKNGQVKN